MKKTESNIHWFFSHHFSPMSGTLFFFQSTEIGKSSLSLPEIFQDQGSGYSLKVSSGSLYGISPVKIPSKCWGWRNLVYVLKYTSVSTVASKNAVEQDVDSWAALCGLNMLAPAQLFICKNPSKKYGHIFWAHI